MRVRQFILKNKYLSVCIFLIILISGFIILQNTSVISVFNSISKRKLPIYCVETDKKQLSISFDAAWGADDTDELLKILKDNDVKATFFLCGYWVDKYPEEVKKIAADGHDLGNHSNTHPHMSQLSLEQIKSELNEAHQKVKNLTNIDMNLFRPPFGEYDNNVITASEQTNYYPIQWDIETLDTKRNKYILKS